MPKRVQSLLVPSASGGLPRELPVITLASRRSGPTAIITANIHGDEVTGVGAIHALIPRLESELERGTVHLYPSLNPDGLSGRSRAVPADRQDLNRLFPGDAAGNPSERLAHVIWKDLAARQPDLVIDLHADSPTSVPYALLDRVTSSRGSVRQRLRKQIAHFGATTGLTALWEYPEARYLEYRLDRSLSGAVINLLRVPAVTIEAGPRLYLEPTSVAVAVSAVMGALTAAGMTRAPAAAHPTRITGGPWGRAAGPRASVAGVFHPMITPGSAVTKGQVLAEVCGLSGRPLERLHARWPAHLITLPERAWVVPGTAAGTFAIRDT